MLKKRNTFSKISLLLIASLIFYNCIGEDVIDDFIEPELRILNPIAELEVLSTYEYEAIYFNNVGMPEDVPISWSSSNDAVLSVDVNGTVTALAEGNAVITAMVIGDTLNTTENLVVLPEDIQSGGGDEAADEDVDTGSDTMKSGTIVTTSSYQLEGSFTISDDGNNELTLAIANDYKASSSLPGLYIYLSNNPNTTNGALEISAVEVFEGEHSYTIQDTGINEYRYILYWCKPFNVKVGEAEIE